MYTVLTPVYNAVAYIGTTIESVLAQTVTDFEYILIDNASTDDSAAIIEGYAKQDKRIKFFRNPQNIGLIGSLNRGFALAQGDWVMNIDSDDVTYPQRLEKQIAFAQAHPTAVLIGSFYHQINYAGKVIGANRQGAATEAEFHALHKAGQITFSVQSTTFVQKQAFTQVGGYDPQFGLAPDLELCDRLSDIGLVLAVPEALIQYRIHASSMSTIGARKLFLQGEYVSYRRQAQTANAPVVSFEAFVEAYNQMPWLQRQFKDLAYLSRRSYRQAGILLSNSQYISGLRHLLIALTTNPQYVIKRLWNQQFSPEARRLRS